LLVVLILNTCCSLVLLSCLPLHLDLNVCVLLSVLLSVFLTEYRIKMYIKSNLTQNSSCSSRMRVINHNWSAMKQRLHPQSVADISRHSVLSGDRIGQCGTSSGFRHKDTDQSPFPSAGTAVSLFRAKTIKQRPLLPREVATRLPDCGVTH